MNYVLYVEVKIALLVYDGEHCASWSVDEWSRVQAYIDELQRWHNRKSKSFSFFFFLVLILKTDQFQF